MGRYPKGYKKPPVSLPGDPEVVKVDEVEYFPIPPVEPPKQTCAMCGAEGHGMVMMRPMKPGKNLPYETFKDRVVGPLCRSHVDDAGDLGSLAEFMAKTIQGWEIERNCYDLGAAGTWAVVR